MTLTPNSSKESARRKFFMNRRTSRLKSRNQTFLGSGARIDSNANSSQESARRKFFMNTTYIMSRK